MKTPLQRFTGRAARRLRGLKRRLVGLRRAARRAAIIGCAAASTLAISSTAMSQMGQAPMAASGGFVTRAVEGLRGINLNGAGRLYYGINAADRGLGYRGSYMTLGGYFPTVEDDLGGLWAADVRSHLSNYGGFFSNVGAVRKQLLGGGSLLGVGVYWDYDGDQNQYEDQLVGDPIRDRLLFPGGFSYNQVGISGEYLTDWGSLRSNGYIPLGSTGQSTGHFASTSVLCMQGINAALGGADLEVGAYVPGLADWAGMINVGGYAYGNTRYELDTGAELVPWFGGVFTRIDLTFAQNWDFSLQYNNDSYFNSTGFARLTYRLGGSRRRNVPDQLEQPMMRNEHIVRAHQNAVEARNPSNGAIWRVLHVDNNAAGSTGTGSVTNPFTTLADAQAGADREHDIVYVHSSPFAYSSGPTDPAAFSFQRDQQYLIGEGSGQTIPTLECGDLRVSPQFDPSLYPTITAQPNVDAIAIINVSPRTGDIVTGEIISGLTIIAAEAGITAASTSGVNMIDEVTIRNGTKGIELSGGANYTITNVTLSSQSQAGIDNAATGTVDLSDSTLDGIAGDGIKTENGIFNVANTTISNTNGNGIYAAGLNGARLTLTNSVIQDSSSVGILADGDASIEVASSQILASASSGIETIAGSIGAISVTGSTIDGLLANGNPAATGAGIRMNSTVPVSLTSSVVSNFGTGVDINADADFTMVLGEIRDMIGDGINIASTIGSSGSANLTGVLIADITGTGISTTGVPLGGTLRGGRGGAVSLINSRLTNIGEIGIVGSNIGTPGTGELILLQGTSIDTATNGGIRVTDSNLRVERSSLQNSRIFDSGPFGIESIAASTVLVDSTQISGATVGIRANATEALSWPTPPNTYFNSLTATNNSISASGTGVILVGYLETTGIVPGVTVDSQGIVQAELALNDLSGSGAQNTTAAGNSIQLTTTGGIVGVVPNNGPAQPPQVTGGLIDIFGGAGRPQGLIIRAANRLNLSALNGNAEVTETPDPPQPETSTTSVSYDAGRNIPQPPRAP